MEQTLLHWVSQYGYGMIFSLLVLGIVGIPVPDETLLAFVGYLIFKGDLRAVSGFLAVFLGTFCGITLSFIIGRTGGVFLLRKYGSLVHMTENRIALVERWYTRKGGWSLIIGYFIPGVRHLTAFVAGMYRLEYSVFARFAYPGALVWSVTFILLGYYGGKEWQQVQDRIHGKILISIGSILVLMFLYYYLWRRRVKRR